MMNVAGLASLSRLASDLQRGGNLTSRQARGISAKVLDTAAEDARRRALSVWTTYGRGMRGSAGTIRARMSNSEETVGYLFADGPGVYMSEYGSGARAPQPVLREAVNSNLDRLARELAQVKIL